MMRQPSPMARLYAWHRAALAGHAPPIHEGLPECGWFKARMVKGGPWVPVKIYVQRDIDPETGELTSPEVLRCEVGSEERDPARMWTYLTPISRADFEALAFLITNTPQMFDPRQKVDLTNGAMRP